MNSEINQIMSNRQDRFDDLTRNRLNNTMMNNSMMNNSMMNNSEMVNDFRNDNDLQMKERMNMLSRDNEFMSKFDESYYLENMKNNKVKKINSEGKVIENEDTDPVKKNLKNKDLDLETLIVERLARNQESDAKRIFSVLEKMYKKFDDDNVKDTYFRVLQSLPKEMFEKSDLY